MLPTDSTRVHCVDPEALAAWVDGGLAAPEAARVETHLASCARCQAMLAAFSQTDADVAPVVATVLPFWSRRPVRWAAAALAAAASLALWTMTRPGEAPPAAETAAAPVQMAEALPLPAPVPPPAQETPPPPDRARAGTVAPTPVPQALLPPVAVPPPPPAPVPATPPPPPPALVPPPVVVSATPPLMIPVTMARQAEMASSALAPPRPVFEVISASEQNAPIVASRLNTSGAAAGGRGGAGAGRGGGLAGNFAGGTVRRPLVRWRVTAASGVERSPDQGQTWEPVILDPPFILTAGSAPYQNVCWLVGEDGVVFRTTNGTSFERTTAPDTVHLVLVGATDALRATVTAIDGRVFETIDGGMSWKPLG